MKLKTLILSGVTLAVSTLVSYADPVDLYIFAGQSNMAGLGQLNQLSKADRKAPDNVFFKKGATFVPIGQPKLKIGNRTGNFGPEWGFVKEMNKLQKDRKIYIVKIGLSGQPLHHGWNDQKWLGGEPAPKRKNFYPGEGPTDKNMGRHYQLLQRSLKQATDYFKTNNIAYKVRGILWMQGEQDSKNERSAREYASSLKRLKRRIEEDLSCGDVPFVFGQVLPHEPAAARFTNRTDIRTCMAAADHRSGSEKAIPNVWMVSTDNMPLRKDTVHYNSNGQLALGKAFATTIVKAQGKN